MTDSDKDITQYCFHEPSPPYQKKNQALEDKLHPPNCIDVFKQRVDQATAICASYAKCRDVICKDYIGRAVMCPPELTLTTSCLYDWSKLFKEDPNQEKEFIKNGSIFQEYNPQTSTECRHVNSVFRDMNTKDNIKQI